MDIPQQIKTNPLWKSALTPKTRTNVGKLIQPFRKGQLLEYHYKQKHGFLQEITFEFTKHPKTGELPDKYTFHVEFHILCIRSPLHGYGYSYGATKHDLTLETHKFGGSTSFKTMHNPGSYAQGFTIIGEPE